MTRSSIPAKLPPLEYCRIERAARILGCEVDDIIHWGAISAIELAILIPHTRPKKALISVKEGLWPRKEELVDEEDPDLGHSITYGEDWGKDNRSWLHRVTPSKHFSTNRDYNTDSFTGLASGPFAVDSCVAISIEAYHSYIGPLWVRHVDTWESYADADVSVILVEADDSGNTIVEDITLTSNDLWITRPQLEKLHRHLTQKIPLPNVYTESGMGNQVKENLFGKHAIINGSATPRGKAIQVIATLLKLIPDLDSEELNPTKTYEIISTMLANKGLEQLPVSDRQFREWFNNQD